MLWWEQQKVKNHGPWFLFRNHFYFIFSRNIARAVCCIMGTRELPCLCKYWGCSERKLQKKETNWNSHSVFVHSVTDSSVYLQSDHCKPKPDPSSIISIVPEIEKGGEASPWGIQQFIRQQAGVLGIPISLLFPFLFSFPRPLKAYGSIDRARLTLLLCWAPFCWG